MATKQAPLPSHRSDAKAMLVSSKMESAGPHVAVRLPLSVDARTLCRAVLLVSLGSLCPGGTLEWPQFGGPHGDFKSDTKGLAGSWPADGPKKLWSRPLGDGYSGISVDGAVLYTMYRYADDEIVLAADANTGKTIWEY